MLTSTAFKSKRSARTVFKLVFKSRVRMKKHLNDRFAKQIDVNSLYPFEFIPAKLPNPNVALNQYISGPQGAAVDTSKDF